MELGTPRTKGYNYITQEQGKGAWNLTNNVMGMRMAGTR